MYIGTHRPYKQAWTQTYPQAKKQNINKGTHTQAHAYRKYTGSLWNHANSLRVIQECNDHGKSVSSVLSCNCAVHQLSL